MFRISLEQLWFL